MLVQLPPNVNIGPHRGGSIVDLPDHVIASLASQQIYPVAIGEDGQPIVLPTQPPRPNLPPQSREKHDPSERLTVTLPQGVKWKDYRGGDLVELTWADVEALEQTLGVYLFENDPKTVSENIEPKKSKKKSETPPNQLPPFVTS